MQMINVWAGQGQVSITACELRNLRDPLATPHQDVYWHVCFIASFISHTIDRTLSRSLTFYCPGLFHFSNCREHVSYIKQVTFGFLRLLGLMQRTKNGWQLLSVFISTSRDFWNCADRVMFRFFVSCWLTDNSSANRFLRNLLLAMWTNCFKSVLNESRFFSRKPIEITKDVSSQTH